MMDSSFRSDNFKELEDKMITYRDLLGVNVKESDEAFQFINPKTIPNKYSKGMNDVKKIFGPRILVRKTVTQKLYEAQSLLKKTNKNLSFFTTYGYRSLERQTERFLWQLKKQKNKFFEDPIDLYEEVHRYVAVPTVAGHPTGGAIDVYIEDRLTGKPLDFGSPQYDYSTKNCYVFTNQILEKQKANRILMRDILTKVGFAPFDGEWWHFSYGDREWAFYYHKKNTIYSQIASNKVKINNS